MSSEQLRKNLLFYLGIYGLIILTLREVVEIRLVYYPATLRQAQGFQPKYFKRGAKSDPSAKKADEREKCGSGKHFYPARSGFFYDYNIYIRISMRGTSGQNL